MIEYHKINSVFKRDEKTKKFIFNEFSAQEFEYLYNYPWVGTEKIDGTNIRVYFNPEEKKVIYSGRTDNSQIPANLVEKLRDIFERNNNLSEQFDKPILFFGEGYGNKIQKCGVNYKPDGVDFILFDVKIGYIWLDRSSVDSIAARLNIKSVSVIKEDSLKNCIEFVKNGFNSAFGNFQAEGLVLVPKGNFLCRIGRRIITKVKYRDFL